MTRRAASVIGGLVLALVGCRSGHTTGGPATAQIHLRFGCETLDGGTIPGCTEHTATLFDGIGPPPFTCLRDNVDEDHGRLFFTFDLSNEQSGVVEGLTLSGVAFVVERPENGSVRGRPDGPCTLTFRDGETYTAACGSLPPSADQPCQIIVFFDSPPWSPDGGGSIYLQCVDVPSITGASRRSVSGTAVAPPPPATDVDPPGAGEFWTCPATRYYQ